MLLISFINTLPECFGSNSNTMKIDWKFTIDLDRIYVEQIITIYPEDSWTRYHQYFDLEIKNFTAFDYESRRQLEVDFVTDPKFHNFTIHFFGRQYSEYEFGLSYFFDTPPGWTEGIVYSKSLKWRFGSEGTPIPQNITVILPEKHDLELLTETSFNTPIDVEMNQHEGRTTFHFSRTSAKGGFFSWIAYFKPRIGQIIIDITNPENGSEVSDLVRLESTASSNETYDIINFRYRIDDAKWIEINETSILWNSSSVQDGAHSILFQAEDEWGSVAEELIYIKTNNSLLISTQVENNIKTSETTVRDINYLSVFGLIGIICTVTMTLFLHKKRSSIKSKPKYEQHLSRLDELRNQGRISDDSYRKLREEYERKLAG